MVSEHTHSKRLGVMRKTITLLLSAVSFLFVPFHLSGCAAHERTIQNLAYQRGKQEAAYTIYLPENHTFVPYYVLEGYGSDRVLLVRKFLLDENTRYNPNEPGCAYYQGSIPDDFLQNEFPKRFPPDFLLQVCSTEIQITEKESLYTGSPVTERISRQFFLLSNSDVFGNGSKIIASEGTKLDFFYEQEHCIARHEDGTSDIWWLRTPDTWYDSLVCTVGQTGALGISSVGGPDGEYSNAIRPAFCISHTAKVVKVDACCYLSGFTPSDSKN